MVPQFRDEVPSFLEQVFDVFQCCPNLWAFAKQLDCPHRCKKVSNPVMTSVGRAKRSRLDSLLASTSLLDVDEDMDDDEEDWETQPKDTNSPAETGDKNPGEIDDDSIKVSKRSRSIVSDSVEQPLKKRKLNRSFAIPPARVSSDPLSWSEGEVYDYVSNEATISHHASWLRQEKIDGMALMLLNLSTLVDQMQLPHGAVLPLAHHLCRLKMAHLLLRNE
ncbi:uncharacterized protein LOC108682198 [Hyalella azteca]|uniref:Uncharacterized protein LOC108682198 n=1 Tax=Hyalella azteca TaxID=294128 RepID=A0A8B7PKV3_HYAAZ|nr:uncharacterized protein LOC108682198 [Hyalella azteca]